LTKPVKTPIRLQGHPAECGAVCLGIVLEYYGNTLSTMELRSRCAVDRDGATIAQIRRGARSAHANCKIKKLGIESLRRTPMPVILHWDLQHYVVFEGTRGDRVYINDPGIGRRRITTREFQKHYTGIALVVAPDEQASSCKAEKERSVIPAEFRRYSLIYWLNVIPALTLFTISVLSFGIKKSFFDYVIEYRAISIGFVAGGVGTVLLLISAYIKFATGLQQARVDLNLRLRLGELLLRRLFTKPVAFFDAHFKGELLQWILCVERFVAARLRRASVSSELLLVVVASGLITFALSPLIALINLMPFVLILTIQWATRHRAMEYSLREHIDSARHEACVHQRAESYQQYYAMGMQRNLIVSCLPGLSRSVAARVESERFSLVPRALLQSAEALFAPLTSTAGAMLVIKGRMSFGDLMLASAVAMLFVEQLLKLTIFTNEQLESRSAERRAEELLAVESEMPPGGSTSQKVASSSTKGNLIDVEEVDFGYNGTDPTILRCASLQVARGEIISIVGPSGAGKTTFLEVLGGVRRPIAGAIRYCGAELRAMAPCGFVFSDDVFVEGDLVSFLCGQNDRDHARAERILQTVEMWSRLGFFINGSGAEKLEEEGLSRGEVQRLLLAQALYRSEECIIFDEAFSHASLAQSKRIIDTLRARRTALIMATHRPDIQALADRRIDIRDLGYTQGTAQVA